MPITPTLNTSEFSMSKRALALLFQVLFPKCTGGVHSKEWSRSIGCLKITGQFPVGSLLMDNSDAASADASTAV
jgi:hypothetical protein